MDRYCPAGQVGTTVTFEVEFVEFVEFATTAICNATCESSKFLELSVPTLSNNFARAPSKGFGAEGKFVENVGKSVGICVALLTLVKWLI